MDNIFVIAMIFSYFSIPRIYQHRVLFWGIIGVIFLRAIMIGVGATLVSQFSWVLYIFAAFLDRKSTRLNSSHVKISYAGFCLKKKTVRKRSEWYKSELQ